MAVTNIVDLVFKVTDNATGPTARIERAMSGLRSVAGLAASAVAGISIASAIKEAISLTSEYEKTVLNTATKFRAFGLGDSFAESELATRSALRAIEDMADKLPGEAAEYVTVFEQIIPKAVKSGMTNVKEIIDFTAQYTALLAGSGIDAGQAARDMVDMLGGRAEVTTRSFTEVIKDLLPPTLATTEAFNHLGAEARRMELQKVFASPAVVEKMAKSAGSLDSKMGEALSKMKRLIKESSAPMFENALKLLDGVNSFISKNADQIGALLTLMGTGVEAAVRLALPPLQFMFQHVEGIARALAVVFGFWAGAKLASFLDGIGSAVKMIKQLAAAMRSLGIMSAIAGMLKDGLSGGIAGVVTALGKAAVVGASVTGAVLAINAALDRVSSTEIKLPKVEDLKFAAPTIPEPAAKKKEEGDKGRKGPPKAEVYIENARFDIRQAFAEGFDPDRIAAAFVDSIGSTALYPGQSGFAAAGTGA